jgi:hypothetical protein
MSHLKLNITTTTKKLNVYGIEEKENININPLTFMSITITVK